MDCYLSLCCWSQSEYFLIKKPGASEGLFSVWCCGLLCTLRSWQHRIKKIILKSWKIMKKASCQGYGFMLYYTSWQIGNREKFFCEVLRYVVMSCAILQYPAWNTKCKRAARLCTSVDSVDRCRKRIIGCFGMKHEKHERKTWNQDGFHEPMIYPVVLGVWEAGGRAPFQGAKNK